MFRKTQNVLARCPGGLVRRPGLSASVHGGVREYSDRPMPWQMDKMTDIGTRQGSTDSKVSVIQRKRLVPGPQNPGNRKIFNEDHDILRESVRKFWQSVPHEDIQKWDEQGYVDKEFWKEVGAQGQGFPDDGKICFAFSR